MTRSAPPGYPVEELGGLIFAYLGPCSRAPLLPRFDGFVAEDAIRMLGRQSFPCNWLQIMENSLDPVHTEWLHGHLYEFVKERKASRLRSAPHAKIAFREFEYGINKPVCWRVSPRIPTIGASVIRWFSRTCSRCGNGDENSRDHAFQIRVPIDDTKTMHFWYSPYVPPKDASVDPKLTKKCTSMRFRSKTRTASSFSTTSTARTLWHGSPKDLSPIARVNI